MKQRSEKYIPKGKWAANALFGMYFIFMNVFGMALGWERESLK